MKFEDLSSKCQQEVRGYIKHGSAPISEEIETVLQLSNSEEDFLTQIIENFHHMAIAANHAKLAFQQLLCEEKNDSP